jgi:YggT family protein
VQVLIYLLQILQVLILVRVVMSWVAPSSRNPIVEFVATVTDPILKPIQALLPRTGPVDFSPMIALFLIYLLQNVLVSASY